MKNLKGYLTAAVCGVISFIMFTLGKTYASVVDMVYPYIIRTLEEGLAGWSGQTDFLIWQLFAVVLLAVALATLILDILLKRSLIRWFGWVLASLSLVFTLHTAVYGLNFYSGELNDDLRLSISDYTLQEQINATRYYRDQANQLAANLNRNAQGRIVGRDFDSLVSRAPVGFEYLTYQRFFPVFAGSTQPVKRLTWSGLFSAMGVNGVTFPLTGESAVSPDVPASVLPFAVCHEMAHRMCIASDRDASFAAFLACSFSTDSQYQYSAYFMAYQYCYKALCSNGGIEAAQAAKDIDSGVNSYLRQDLEEYEHRYNPRIPSVLRGLHDSLWSVYLNISGASELAGEESDVSRQLTMWYIQEVVLPATAVEEQIFDPKDPSQVDLSGIVNARRYA